MDRPTLDWMLSLQPVLLALARAWSNGTPILFITQSNADPITSNEQDGYVQRVRSIDAIFKGRMRIYLQFDEEQRNRPSLERKSDEVYCIIMARQDPIGKALILAILGEGAQVYMHSILPLGIPFIWEIFDHRTGAAVLDLHGAVPEEFLMQEDPFSANVYEKYEQSIVNKVDLLVCVSEQMAQHLAKKYSISTDKCIICPIFTSPSFFESRSRAQTTRPRIVYVGGTQIWQQIPKMIDAIATVASRIDYVVLTPDPPTIVHEFREKGIPPEIALSHVRSAKSQDVTEVLLKSHFGFLLRSNLVVNRVACPTKLIEYLNCGVVPVLDSPEVGDFVQNGMRYVPLEDFKSGKLPDAARQSQMADENRIVLDKLAAQSAAGTKALYDVFGPTLGAAEENELKNSRYAPKNASGPLTRPAKIGLVVPAFDKGGLEQIALNLYRSYRAAGNACVILVEGGALGYMSSLVPSEDIFSFNAQDDHFVRALVTLKFDVLHFHYSTYGLQAASALGIYTIYTIHNIYTWLDDESFARVAGEITQAKRIVAVSNFVKDYFCNRARLSEDRIDVISNGIDTRHMVSTNLSISRQELSLPDGRFVFAMVASFHRVKHHSVVVAAIEELLKFRSDFHVLFVGNVGDVAYFAQIKSMIDASVARGHMTICDYLPREKLFAAYKSVVDCILLPTMQEGCSNVVLEAVAFQKPLIMSDVGNARDVICWLPHAEIIPPAASPLVLNPQIIDKLSNAKTANNLKNLVSAMNRAIDNGPIELAELSATILEQIDSNRMASLYLNLIKAEAPFLACKV